MRMMETLLVYFQSFSKKVKCLTLYEDLERPGFLSNSHNPLTPLIAQVTRLPPPKRQSIAYIEVDIERANGRTIHVIPECHLAVSICLVKRI